MSYQELWRWARNKGPFSLRSLAVARDHWKDVYTSKSWVQLLCDTKACFWNAEMCSLGRLLIGMA